ncbi:trypsin domain-containing protein [Ditylenchus destructor]|uniref:Trypsin domain-containing protein n=1 Tax=Ditylenchus destructor TaxID=166010 RepID=A0AAD4MMD0_9BILA|nr:trypsin domain-containing protein [Ditylenchus destructor]
MLLFSLLLLLVNFCAIYGGDEERQGVYGLLQRLDREEAEEIYSFCLGLKRRSGFSQAKFGDDHHRISNGRPLDMTVGAYTALLYDPDLGSVQCTATFISWRHLVTAAHCIYLDLSHKTKLKLMAGGVHPPGHGDDMIELDYTVIVGFGNLPDEDKPGMETWEENFYIAQGDFAIIQLEESVPDYLKHDRIEIMCLPKANEAMPDKLNVYGFGLMSKDVQTDVLRGYTTRTNIVTSTMCEKSDRLVCQTTSFQNGCIMNADSGGGSWEFNGDDIRTIYAINTKIDDEQRSRCIVTGLRVSKVVHDICRYLDLCPAGADSTQAYLTAKMIYLTHERSWYSDIGWQLSYIPDEYNKLYEERCNKPYNETTGCDYTYLHFSHRNNQFLLFIWTCDQLFFRLAES